MFKIGAWVVFYAMINLINHGFLEKNLPLLTTEHRCLSGDHGAGAVAVATTGILAWV